MAKGTQAAAPNAHPGPTRASVRQLLQEVLCSDSDFDAFCLDRFGDIHRRFSDGMDRVRKLNLLLEHADPAGIVAKLREHDPPAVAQHEHLLVYEDAAVAPDAKAEPLPAEEPRYPDDATRHLSEGLDEAHRRRQALAGAGASTSDVDREILELRRKLRAGNQLRAGDSLSDGRYLLLEAIGKGGFAIVWRALDRTSGVPVAIKVLHGMLVDDPIRRERFFRGARTMASLHHEAILRVIDAEGEDEGFHYFVMELAEGGDLRKAVLEGRIRGEDALRILLPVGDALAFAHAQGFVHRDVKPQNILLDAAGHPKLSDFDLVGGTHTTGGTRTGALGTFLYSAPEMMNRPQDADARADVYGLGMTAIFCMHGADLPLDVVRSADRILDGIQCSKALRAVLRKAIEWDAVDRFADVEVFCGALLFALSQGPAASDATQPDEAAKPTAASGPWLNLKGWRFAATIVLLTLGAIIGLRWMRPDGEVGPLPPASSVASAAPSPSAASSSRSAPLFPKDGSPEAKELGQEILAESAKRHTELNERPCNTSSASLISSRMNGKIAPEEVSKAIEREANALANCMNYRGISSYGFVAPTRLASSRYLLRGHLQVEESGKVKNIDSEYRLFSGDAERLRSQLFADPESFRLASTERLEPLLSMHKINERMCIGTAFSDNQSKAEPPFPRSARPYTVSFVLHFACAS